MGKMIVFTAMDGVGYGSVAAVEQRLKEEGFDTLWVVGREGVAIQKLQKANRSFGVFEDFRLFLSSPEQARPVSAIVAGVSSKSGPDLFFARDVKERGIPVVKILDFWGTGQPHEKASLQIAFACSMKVPLLTNLKCEVCRKKIFA